MMFPEKQKTRRDFRLAGYFLTFLSILSGGAAHRVEPIFCMAPLHSARYDKVPHAVFADLALVACRCFLFLSAACFMKCLRLIPRKQFTLYHSLPSLYHTHAAKASKNHPHVL
jgi:hypothetical protein